LFKNQEIFSDPFTEYGGILPKEKYTTELEVWLENFNYSFSDLFLNKNHPKIIIEFINNSEVNACVCKVQESYVIGIYLGFIYVVNDLFFRMLSSPNVLVKYGNASIEQVRKIKNAQITDSDILYLAKHNDKRNTPLDDVRSRIAIALSVFCFNHLVLHEYAHIALGHVDYLAKINDQNIHFENQIQTSEVDYRFRHNCELEADAYATNLSLHTLFLEDYTGSGVNDMIKPYLRNVTDRVFLWNFAIYSQKRLFGYRKYQLRELKNLSHPPPSLRQHVTIGVLRSIIKVNSQDEMLKENIEDIIRKSLLEVESAFAEISEQPFDMDAYSFVFQEEIKNYHDDLKNANAVVKLKLEPFAFFKY